MGKTIFANFMKPGHLLTEAKVDLEKNSNL